jgi:amino acid permease
MASILVTICGIYSYGDAYYTYALISVLYAMFYIFFCLLFDITQLEKQIVDIVTDYLDNTVSHRIKATEVKVPAVNAAATTRELNSPQVSAQTSRRKSSQNTQKNNPDEIIFSVINDFLI